MARHADVLSSPLVAEHFAIFIDAERVIADPVVRNRGTVGGSLCQADPSEDLSAAFAAVRATVVIRGSGGERIVPARELHVGPYETVVGPAEVLTEIRVPMPGCGSAYEKVDGGRRLGGGGRRRRRVARRRHHRRRRHRSDGGRPSTSTHPPPRTPSGTGSERRRHRHGRPHRRGVIRSRTSGARPRQAPPGRRATRRA
jgi:hypothetical protein